MNDLPVHGTVVNCPICQSDAYVASKAYHEGAQGAACTLMRMNNENTPELLTLLERHICRYCTGCGGMWVEALPEADPS